MAHPRPTVLVLGATGALGSLLARTFASEGWEVVRGGRRPQAGPGPRLLGVGGPARRRRGPGAAASATSPAPDGRPVAGRGVRGAGPAPNNRSAPPAAPGWRLKREAGSPNGLV